jgi:oxalate decarboxylase/phosphoglucose isomerase-like protein (cupin superfamily)
MDPRGGFLKLLTGKEEGLPAYSSEFYITTALPGMAKGGHFHPRADEWFTLIKGTCQVKLQDIESGEKMTLELRADDPSTLFVPAGVAHVFINDGKEDFILCAYSSLLYDPADTVTVELI